MLNLLETIDKTYSSEINNGYFWGKSNKNKEVS